jgi:hypothetical protein
VPVDGFFEWRAIKGARAKQPYAIAMKDGSPFGLAGLWENWRNPNTGEWERTFAIITVPSNPLVAKIHNRMPAILDPGSYDRWLSTEPDPHDLLMSYPSEPMTMWPAGSGWRSLRRMGSLEVGVTRDSASGSTISNGTGTLVRFRRYQISRSVLLSPLSGTNSGANFGFNRVLHDDPSHMCRLTQGANQ